MGIYVYWRRKWQPTTVFLPGESHEQRSLADYNPWARKESDTTEKGHTCADKGLLETGRTTQHREANERRA